MSTMPIVPRGRIIVQLFEKDSKVDMTGNIKPSDINLLLMSVRRTYVKYLSEIGANNKKRVEQEQSKVITEVNNGQG